MSGEVLAFSRRKRRSPPTLRCLGVARDAENPRAVVVVLSRPLTDAELAVFHDGCRQAAPLAEVACRPEEPNS